VKCSVISENFKKALSYVERATGKDTTIPILGSFFISTEGSTVKIIGTNLEIGIQAIVRGTIQESGAVVIPARPLLAFIATLSKNEKITLESRDVDLVVSSGAEEVVFKGYSQEDFPPFPDVKELYCISAQKEDMLGVLQRSLIAAARSSVKPELASVYFLCEREFITIAATDSFRLAEQKIKPTAISKKLSTESFLVPVRTCEEIIRIFEYGEEKDIKFFIGKGEIKVVYSDIVLYSRLTEGVFPQYQPIIPKKFTTQMTIKKKEIERNIKRASIFTDKLQGISLQLSPKQSECMMESKNNLGTYKTSLKTEIQGESLAVVFNYHYLLDGVESFGGENIFFGFSGEASPLLIRVPKEEHSFYVVMPMRGNT